jgi:hypothetical protein
MKTLASRGWFLSEKEDKGKYHMVALMGYTKQEGRLLCEITMFASYTSLEVDAQPEWHTWVHGTISREGVREQVDPQLLLTAEEIGELLEEYRTSFPANSTVPVYLYLPNSHKTNKKWDA